MHTFCVLSVILCLESCSTNDAFTRGTLPPVTVRRMILFSSGLQVSTDAVHLMKVWRRSGEERCLAALQRSGQFSNRSFVTNLVTLQTADPRSTL